MPQLSNTPRPSMSQNLENLYYSVNANPTPPIRSHIVNRQGVMSWGLSAAAGAPSYASTRFIYGQGFNTEFTPFTPLQQGTYTNNALQYSTNTLKINTVRYGSGTRGSAQILPR